MKKSVQYKLLFLFLLSLLVSLTISFGIHFLFFRQYYLHHTETRLLSVFEEVEENLQHENFEELVAEIDFRQQVGIIIADESFSYSFFSHILTSETGDKLSLELQNLILNQKEILENKHICIELRDSTVDGEEDLARMVFIKKLSDGNYCILSHPLETLESSMNAMEKFHAVAGVVACISGIFITLFFARSFTKPILAINEATKKMSQLDFQQKINHKSQDELGELAENINILSETLEEYKTALKKEIDFQKVLSQNMSHELKTPIAVMKGYLEAISYGIAAKKGKTDEYVSIVLCECDRMTELINQMLQLSKLTSALEHQLEQSTFTSVTFAEKIKKQHSPLLKQHQIEFIQEIQQINLWGNQELLLQCFGNFITNAVKYGDNKKIVMKIQENDTDFIYSCFNTGAQMEEEELTKIFDVFYMVDKSRSREKNSHGLGLSLCKSVAELHQGSIFANNSPDGVAFYLKIPKNHPKNNF